MENESDNILQGLLPNADWTKLSAGLKQDIKQETGALSRRKQPILYQWHCIQH